VVFNHYTQRLVSCQGAKAAQYLASGRAVMFRMNGISRVSTWMCGAIVSGMHGDQFVHKLMT